ncbi:MAG TPA: Spy/CpxP family protein refolding chaperone [Polyangiaceae bacterium]|jgi:Spy/CpxP family protein refolding chaperone
MNRWIRTIGVFGVLAGTLALVPAGVALADDASSAQGAHHGHKGHHREGLIHEALKLDSLTSAQRTAIEKLVDQKRAASAPVRAADAQVLTALAKQVEQATVDANALAPVLAGETSAATAESAAERDILNQLHGILTPAQRSALVDRIEARAGRMHAWARDAGAPGAAGSEGFAGRGPHGPWGHKLGLTAEQKAQIAANLHASGSLDGGFGPGGPGHGARKAAVESFRGDTFDGGSLAKVEHRGEMAERLAAAMVPVLTPAQRSALANTLRERAAHETRS